MKNNLWVKMKGKFFPNRLFMSEKERETIMEGKPIEALTQEEAEAQIREILADAESPFFYPFDPLHGSIVERVKALYQKAFPPEIEIPEFPKAGYVGSITSGNRPSQKGC